MTQAFTRTIGEPGNARTDSARDHILLSWDPRLGAKEYKVEISSSPDFSRVVERATTDNPSFAPLMTLSSYAAGGTLYWRVAAADEDRNQGDWTQIQQIRLQPRLRLSVSGFPKHKRAGNVTARVVDGKGHPLAGVSRAGDRSGGEGRLQAHHGDRTGHVQAQAEEAREARLQRFEVGLPAGVRSPQGPMNRPRDGATQRGHRRVERQAERGAEWRRHWRVVRIPPAHPARPRFTT